MLSTHTTATTTWWTFSMWMRTQRKKQILNIWLNSLESYPKSSIRPSRKLMQRMQLGTRLLSDLTTLPRSRKKADSLSIWWAPLMISWLRARRGLALGSDSSRWLSSSGWKCSRSSCAKFGNITKITPSISSKSKSPPKDSALAAEAPLHPPKMPTKTNAGNGLVLRSSFLKRLLTPTPFSVKLGFRSFLQNSTVAQAPYLQRWQSW